MFTSLAHKTSYQFELKNLSCERGGLVLFAGLNLSITGGEFIQIEGPNGSGKTTLLKALTTLSVPFAGDIEWQGQSLYTNKKGTNKNDFFENLLYIGHKPAVKSLLTPRENLTWYHSNQYHPNQSSSIDIEAALKKVGLYSFEDQPCFTLSVGQLQRVALARLFLTSAKLWVLDEPFTAIDKAGVAELESVLSAHVEGGGIVILTTHHAIDNAKIKRVNLLDFPVRREGGSGE